MGARIRKKTVSVSSLILIIILTLLGAPGCSEEKPIKVGFVGGLTGRLSDLGISGRNGVLLAVEETNKAGGIKGRKIELVVKDDKQDPDTALKVDQELIEAGVVAIIGHMTSGMSIAALPLINKEKMLLISPTTSSNKMTGFDDYFIRVMPPNKSETDHLARNAYDDLGLKKIAALYDLSNQAYTEEFYNNFRMEFEKKGGRIVFVRSFTSGIDSDFTSLTEGLLDSKPDGVLIVAGAMDTAMLCQWIRKTEPDLPILSCGWAMTTDFLQHGGPAVEGVRFSHLLDKESKHKVYLDFKERFRSRFGRESDFAAAHGYEAARLLFTVLSECKDFKNLKTEIINQSKFSGVQGEFVIDRYGDAQRRRHLIVPHQGVFKTVE